MSLINVNMLTEPLPSACLIVLSKVLCVSELELWDESPSSQVHAYFRHRHVVPQASRSPQEGGEIRLGKKSQRCEKHKTKE
jgi:hypothetical protein